MENTNTKKLSDCTTVTTFNSNQKVILTDDEGNTTIISLADLKSALLGGVDLKSSYDGVFIMCHRNSDNYPVMYKPDKWTAQQNAGETALGVVVVEGGRMLVVAPTEANLYWSSAEVAGGGTTTTNRLVAFDDWEGKANTTAQIEHDECSDEQYAPGFCAAYEKVNGAGNGLDAGKWWLPSMGEMMCIFANMRKINYALSLITGATQLAETFYWTSSECSATSAWRLTLGGGYAGITTKATNQFRVRPVSAFI